MPKVPSYDSFQVGLDAGQSARVQAPDFQDFSGKQQQQLGQSIEKAGQGLLASNMYAERMVGTAQAKEGDNQGMGFINELLHNDKSGYLNMAGKAAVDSKDAVLQQLNEGMDKIEQGLQSESAKAMFATVKQQRLQQAMVQIDSHAATQAKAYNIGETTSNLQNQLNNAALNWTNPQLVAQGYASAKNQFNQLAALQGWGGEQLKEKERGFNTAYVGTMVNKMIGDNNPTAARQFLDSHAELVDQSKVDDLRKLVKTSSLADESLKLALTLNPNDLQGSEKKVQKMFLDGQLSAEGADATIQRLRQMHQDAKVGEEDSRKAVLGKAQDWILHNPNKSILDMPPQYYNSAMKYGYLNSLAEFAKSGGNQATDMAQYASIYSRIADDPSQVSDSEIMAAKLSDPDKKKMLDMRGKVNAKDDKESQAITIVNNAVKASMTSIQAAIGTGANHKNIDADTLNNMKGQMIQYVQAHMDDIKGNPDAAHNLANAFLQQQRISRSGIFSVLPDTKKRVFQMSEDDIGGIGFDQIPSADAAEISKTLSSKGIKPTNDKIVEVYTKHLKALKGLN